MRTLNWVYGALAPTTNLDLVEDQMYQAHRYRNAIIHAEHLRRRAFHRRLAGRDNRYDNAVAVAEANQQAISDIYTARADRSQAARAKLPFTDAEHVELQRLVTGLMCDTWLFS